MNPLAWVIVAGVVFLSGLTAGVKVMSWKHGAAEKARIVAENEAYEKSSARVNEVSAKLEAAVANIEKKRIVVEREIRHEIEKPVYRDCIVPASGVLIYNRAGESAANPGQHDATLPIPGDIGRKR